MQIGGCLPGHFARAHGGGNSSNSLSKDLDRVRRHWQGPCWVAVVVVDAEVWELKLPRLLMAGYSWEGCPAAGGLYGCCHARAHAFDDELCPVHRPATSCVARGILVSGCAARTGGLPGPRVPSKWLVRRTRRGAAFAPVVSSASLTDHERGRRPRRPRYYC